MNTITKRAALMGMTSLGAILALSVQAYAVEVSNGDLAEGSDIIVTATAANEIAPVTVSLQTTQPQAVISRSFIEDSLPATADFNTIALISPGVSNYGGTNGVGLSESKAQIRGFQDGEYNITFDGVPFGDQNDPTHHSNTFFPSNTIETLVVDRGPGNASQLGQATFGGNMNMFSRETRADASAELKGSYGTYDTTLLRGVLQSGAIHALNGAEVMVSGQYTNSDGARTYSPFKAKNIFGKIMLPITPDVKLTLLATYNENEYNQPDKDGTTLAQVALFGKSFSLNNDPTTQNYYGYNHTKKKTDFEIVKLEADLTPTIRFENRGYTYSYNNQTLSGGDSTLYGTDTALVLATKNVVKLVSGGSATPGVPGYTKTNKYRVWGDIAKVRADFGFGAVTAGMWYEKSNTYRQQRNFDLLTGVPNYKESAVTNPITGALTPRDIKYDQNSSIQHAEEFAELELRPFEGLKITPGIKHVYLKRKIDALVNSDTRYAQNISSDWKATLPFATVNYAANEQLSFYGQYARGFLIPPLDVLYVDKPELSKLDPQRSTNYQLGGVYHGDHVSFDADVYLIKFNNKFTSSTSPVPGEGTIWTNEGAVTYRGVEAQLTYAFGNGAAFFVNFSRNEAKTDNPGEANTQVANAPKSTAAAGVLYRKGPIHLSFIDKYTGPQYAVSGEVAAYRIQSYHNAIFTARYDFGIFRLGVEVNNVFGSRAVVDIDKGKTLPYDKYFYQAGRQVMADLTVKF